jgi:hypothetical protein
MSVTHPQVVMARLSMSLPLITAGQIMYLCYRIWIFQGTKRGIENPLTYFHVK